MEAFYIEIESSFNAICLHLLQGLYDFLPYREVLSVDGIAEFCRKYDYLCDLGLVALAGPSTNIDPERMQVYMSEGKCNTLILCRVKEVDIDFFINASIII